MKPILVFDENNSKCALLKELFNFIGSKKNRKEMSRNHISTKETYIDLFKVIFMSIFFQIEKSYIVRELNKSVQLRKDYGFF